MKKFFFKRKINSSILLFLFIFSSSSLLFSAQANNNSSKGESVQNSEELKLSGTYWTTTEVVSTESISYSRDPTIAVDDFGNVHVAWGDTTNYSGSGTDSDIFYKRWNSTGSTWTTTKVVSNESAGGSGDLNSSTDPTIAVDGNGNVHLAWNDETNYGGSGADTDIFYKRWDATSSNWTTTEVVSTESAGPSIDPTIAVDDAGNVHLAWEDLTNYGSSGTDRDIFYKLRNATSSTWTTTEVVSTEDTDVSRSPTIAVDDVGNIHVAWNYWGINFEIFYKRWNVTSSAWTTTEVVSTEVTTVAYEPTIAVDGTGNVHVAWYEYSNYGGSGTDKDIFYKRWNATSSTWTTIEVVSTESTHDSMEPTIAVDDVGNIHVAWSDLDIDGNDIFYKRWSVTSSTWTTTEDVSTESTDYPFLPTIAVDGAGNVHVAWYELTGYGDSGYDNDIFYKRLAELPSEPSDQFILTIIIIASASIAGGIGVVGITIFLLRKRRRA